PSATTIMNGKPSHTFVRMQAENASQGRESHCTGDMWKNFSSARLIGPYSWWNIARQESAVMYWGTAHGTISKVRKSGRAGSAWSSSIASATPIVTWKITFTAVQRTVFPSTAYTAGSVSTA